VFFFGIPVSDVRFSEDHLPTWIDGGKRSFFGVPGNHWRGFNDHVIVFHENALRRTLNSYFDYYHRSKTHLSLGKDSTEPRAIRPGKWDRSWRYRRSGDCTTATNHGPPKEPKSSVLRVASARTLEICLRTVLRCTRVPARISFTRLEQVHELLEPRGLVKGMTSPMGCTEKFGRDNWCRWLRVPQFYCCTSLIMSEPLPALRCCRPFVPSLRYCFHSLFVCR
jgi:hypothetical protein